MRFFFSNYRRFKVRKEAEARTKSALAFIEDKYTPDKSILTQALKLMDVGLTTSGYEAFLYEHTPAYISTGDDAPKKRYLHEDVSATEALNTLQGKQNSFTTEMAVALIKNHHAIDHYAENDIGWQECKAVKRLIDKYAAHINTKINNWAQANELAKDFVTLFYQAVNASNGYPIGNDVVQDYVNQILAEVVLYGQANSIKRLRKNIGPVRASDDEIKNMSQSTIIGSSMLNHMNFSTRQALVDYISAVINRNEFGYTQGRWPIKYIDLRSLTPYVDDIHRIKDAITSTLGRDIVRRNERHIEYSIVNGVLSFEIY